MVRDIVLRAAFSVYVVRLCSDDSCAGSVTYSQVPIQLSSLETAVCDSLSGDSCNRYRYLQHPKVRIPSGCRVWSKESARRAVHDLDVLRECPRGVTAVLTCLGQGPFQPCPVCYEPTTAVDTGMVVNLACGHHTCARCYWKQLWLRRVGPVPCALCRAQGEPFVLFAEVELVSSTFKALMVDLDQYPPQASVVVFCMDAAVPVSAALSTAGVPASVCTTLDDVDVLFEKHTNGIVAVVDLDKLITPRREETLMSANHLVFLHTPPKELLDEVVAFCTNPVKCVLQTVRTFVS